MFRSPVGLGTMGIDDPGPIATALDVGYRHLDTARIYRENKASASGLDPEGEADT